MKLTRIDGLKAQAKEKGPIMQGEKAKPAMKAALAALLVAAPMILAACDKCPVDDSCNTNEFEITLKEGESKETVSNGDVVTIDVLSISRSSAMEGGRCVAYGGSATLHIHVESETPFDQDVVVAPSACFAITNRCIGINDVSIGSDFQAPDAGVAADGGTYAAPTAACTITNKSVTFTLTLGE